jgi:lysozyme
MDRAKLRAELIRDEGMRLEAYQDSVGLWTIGVGHLLGTEKRMTRISPDECDALLNVDIDWAIRTAERFVIELPLWPYGHNESRARALVNMAFNLGPRLGQFKKFLGSVNGGNWETAAVQMMQSKWAKQVGARAERLRDMILVED